MGIIGSYERQQTFINYFPIKSFMHILYKIQHDILNFFNKNKRPFLCSVLQNANFILPLLLCQFLLIVFLKSNKDYNFIVWSFLKFSLLSLIRRDSAGYGRNLTIFHKIISSHLLILLQIGLMTLKLIKNITLLKIIDPFIF